MIRNSTIRKGTTLAAALWIGIAASTAYADSSGAGGSWVAAVIAWLSGTAYQPDDNGTIHVNDNGVIHLD